MIPPLASDYDFKRGRAGGQVPGRTWAARSRACASTRARPTRAPMSASCGRLDGTLLASATFAGETASGWQQVSFPSPVPVAAGTTYVASYHTNAGPLRLLPGGYFASAGSTARRCTRCGTGRPGATGCTSTAGAGSRRRPTSRRTTGWTWSSSRGRRRAPPGWPGPRALARERQAGRGREAGGRGEGRQAAVEALAAQVRALGVARRRQREQSVYAVIRPGTRGVLNGGKESSRPTGSRTPPGGGRGAGGPLPSTAGAPDVAARGLCSPRASASTARLCPYVNGYRA